MLRNNFNVILYQQNFLIQLYLSILHVKTIITVHINNKKALYYKTVLVLVYNKYIVVSKLSKICRHVAELLL